MTRVLCLLGMPGAGTGALRARLVASRADLEARGLMYPDLGSGPGHDGLAGLAGGGDADDAGAQAGPWEALRRQVAGRDRCVILSVDLLCRELPDAIDWATLARRLGELGEVKVVLAFPSLDQVITAQWLDAAESSAPPEPAGFVARAIGDRAVRGCSLNLKLVRRHLVQGFGRAGLHMLDLGPRPEAQALTRAVLALADPGIDWTDSPLLAPFAEAGDPGTRALALLATERINPERRDDPTLKAAVEDALREGAEGGARNHLLTRAELAGLRHVLAIPNGEFAARVRKTQAGFALTRPPLPGAEERCREDLTPDFWASVAAALFRSGRSGFDTASPSGRSAGRVWRRILGIGLG